MAGLGFFLGGAAQGYDKAIDTQSMVNYRQQELQIQQKAQQNAQQRDQNSNYMKIRSDAISHLDDTMTQLQIAHPDWSALQLSANPAVLAMKTQIGTLDQNLKLPSTIDSIVASLAERPSQAVTAGILAQAQDPYKSQLEATTIQEKQANIAALKQSSALESAASGPGGGPNAATPTATPDATPDEAGEQFLQKLPPGARDQVKAIAEYRENPNNLPARIAKGANQSQRELYVGLAEQYAAARGEQYDQTQFAGRSKAVNDFSAGKTAAQVRGYNVLTDHLGVLGEAATALGNGDIRSFNTIKNAIAAQTGESAPTDFNGVKELVGDEIVKAVSGGAGALGDRDQIKATINGAGSPKQLQSLITKYQKLAGEQLSGLRDQYESTTGRKDFGKFLNARTKKFFDQPPDSSDQGGDGMSGTSGPVKWKVVQ